jgi:hypothetical protein
MSFFSGSLETASSYQPFLSFFKVRLRFRMPIDQESVAVERSTAVQADGTYQIEIAAEALTDPAATLSVLGPTSETLAGGLLAELLADAFQLKPIKVSGDAPDIVLEPLTGDQTAPLRRLKIRVFVAAAGVIAGKVAAGVDVQLLGRLRGAAQSAPLASGTTDANGYLSLTVANVPFDALLARTGRGAQINDSAIPLTAEGKAPLRIILTTPATETLEDCHCELAPPRLPDADELAENSDVYSTDLGAGCEDFTIPNRTLEEFDFFLIVRTTDPDIRGLTLPDGVSAQVAGGPLLKLAFDRATLSQELRTVELASAPAAATQAVTLTSAEGRSQRELAGNRAAIDEIAANQTSLQLQEVLPAYVDVRPLAAAGTITAAQWRESTDEKIAEAALNASLAKIPARALRAALQDPDGFTPVRLMTLERCASIDALKAYLAARRKKAPGRAVLDEDNPVDWDESPEFYQAASIAHGHLLHFKQEWKADGYSLGELVKSIPLAPGQKKQIAILDWDREDTAGRSEVREASESLTAFLSRDRDINEIANAGFRESIRGGSRARTGAVGGGFGFAIGPLVIGGGGGAAWSSSTAWNEGSRELTGQTLNQLREEISQGVSTVRNQRSAVIQTVGQRERVTATTEVIANHNRCHAMTLQYFEVLRHFAVQERLAGVQECLFVPLQMAPFDDAKVLRWRDLLREACRKPAVREGFEAIWRLSSPATMPPDRAFADDPIEEMSGRIFLRVSIARPKDPDEASRAVLEQTEWRFFGLILRVHPEVVYEQYRRNEQRRDQIFRSEIAPEITRQFLESLRVVLIDRDGNEHEAGFDLTLLSRYVEGGLMEVALNDTGRGPRLSRREVTGIEIRTDHALPEFSRVIVEQANFTYRTQRFAQALYRNERVLDDLLASDPAFLSTAVLSRAEERNQLREDRELRRRLLRHLNDHLEYYHRAIWWQMDAARRFMLLDGFEAPHAGGRSVASVVENRLIGIVGNALVLPVAPGFQLDPALRQVLKENEDPLVALNTLYDTAPSLPRRHSVPTRGVFAEAMNGKCNSCEVMEEDRFWRWKDFPLPDSPPPIGELSTDSRFATPESLAPTGFPDALVKFQNVPGAPLPSGMNAALSLLGKDVFKDLTGLTQNQKNAMAALTTAFGSSEAFAGEAFKLALAEDAARNLDRTIDQAEAARKAGLLTDEQASKATRDALLRALGEEGAEQKDVTELPGVKQALEQLGSAPSGSATVTRSSGENSETVEVKKEDGSALIIGAPLSVVVRELPPIVTQTPLVLDDLTANELEHRQIFNSRQVAAVRKRLFQAVPGQPDKLIDLFQSAVDAGFLRVDGSHFRMNVRVRIGYPADPADTSKIAQAEVAGARYPLVVLLHGNAAGWSIVPGSTAAPTGGSHQGKTLYSVPLHSQANHAGYDYLQRWLAESGRRMVSVSIETNVANTVGALTDLRAQMVLDVLAKLKEEAKKTGSLFSQVDFQNIGLVGHSRGGEAVVLAQQLNSASTPFAIKAVCALAPTDVRGGTTSPLSVARTSNASLLVVYGGLDLDVSGTRIAGTRDTWGNGFRLYDRSTAHKAMVFLPFCCHTRFNQIWDAVGRQRASAQGLPSGAQIEGGQPLPANTHSTPLHEALAQEYIGGYFDLALNRDFGLRALFDNSLPNAPAKPAALQWRFGALTEVIDEFTAPNPLATLPTGATRIDLTPIVVPVGATTGSRDKHVLHSTQALLIDLAAVAAASASVRYRFAAGAGASRDLTGFDAITFRLGVLSPVVDQTAIEAAAEPVFTVSLTDHAGVTGTLTSAEMFADLANGWTKPAFKIDGSDNATLMFMQTVPFNFATLLLKSINLSQPGINLAEAESLTLEFDTSAGSGEIWLDSLLLIKV